MVSNMKMLEIVYKVVFWFLSVTFVLAGLGGFMEGEWLCAAVIFATGIVICPLFEKFMRSKYPNYPRWASLALLFVGLFAFGYWGITFGMF